MMQQKEIFKKIGSIITEIYDQYKYLSENPDQLNDLELELFSANSDFLAEHVKVLRKVNLGIQGSVPLAKSESKAEAEVLPVSKKEEGINEATNSFTAPNHIEAAKPAFVPEEVKAPEIAKQETLIEPQPEIVSQEQLPEEAESTREVESTTQDQVNQQVEEISEPQMHSFNGGGTVAEVATEPVIREVIIPEKVANVDVPVESSQPSVQTLNDIISAQKAAQAQTTEPIFNKQPISDLKTAINLNDKLLFIKDLFNGYSLAYSEAIEILNRFESFTVAETFLKANYAVKNHWDTKPSTVEKFYDVLNRRYLK